MPAFPDTSSETSFAAPSSFFSTFLAPFASCQSVASDISCSLPASRDDEFLVTAEVCASLVYSTQNHGTLTIHWEKPTKSAFGQPQFRSYPSSAVEQKFLLCRVALKLSSVPAHKFTTNAGRQELGNGCSARRELYRQILAFLKLLLQMKPLELVLNRRRESFLSSSTEFFEEEEALLQPHSSGPPAVQLAFCENGTNRLWTVRSGRVSLEGWGGGAVAILPNASLTFEKVAFMSLEVFLQKSIVEGAGEKVSVREQVQI